MAIDVDRHMSSLDGVMRDKIRWMNQEVHGPYWEDRRDLIRNVVTIAAATFAASTTLFDRVIGQCSPSLAALLLACWLFLMLSAISGMYALQQAAELRSIYPRYFNSRPRIRSQFENLNPHGTDADGERVAKSCVDAALAPTGRHDHRARVAVRLSQWFFGVGLVALYVIAAYQLCH